MRRWSDEVTRRPPAGCRGPRIPRQTNGAPHVFRRAKLASAAASRARPESSKYLPPPAATAAAASRPSLGALSYRSRFALADANRERDSYNLPRTCRPMTSVAIAIYIARYTIVDSRYTQLRTYIILCRLVRTSINYLFTLYFKFRRWTRKYWRGANRFKIGNRFVHLAEKIERP